jgi:hypothetical protein
VRWRPRAGPGTLGLLAGTQLLASTFLVSATGAVAPLAAGPAPSFSPPRTYSTGRETYPSSVAIGDLNGDGSPDLVAVDSYPSAVFVLLNRGDGSFRAKRKYRAGPFPEMVTIGDLNGDGKLDLATISPRASTVSTLINRGDGSFEPKRDYRTGRQPLSVAIGDLTGDGKAELVTANAYLKDPNKRNPGTVSVFVNKGDGSFQPKLDYRPGKFPRSVALSDVNGDGRLDLATANADANTVSVFINRGDGSLGPRRDYRAGAGPRWLEIGDLNHDRSLDLVVANTRAVKLSVLLNKGDGSFRAPRSYRTAPPHAADLPHAIAIGDLNGDRKPDVATVGECSFAISVLGNRGDGSFAEKIDYRTSCAKSVAIGDLNGDGKNDLATANDSPGVSVFINRPGRCTVQPVLWIGLAAAKRATIRANCRVGTIRRAYSRFGKGTVMAQKPKFGAVLPKGGKVSLVVSRRRKG